MSHAFWPLDEILQHGNYDPGHVRTADARAMDERIIELNGTVVQGVSVSNMTFDIGYIVADLSRHITFLSGDVILTGTPANSRPMAPGDTVELEVSGVGRLTNLVREVLAERPPPGGPGC